MPQALSMKDLTRLVNTTLANALTGTAAPAAQTSVFSNPEFLNALGNRTFTPVAPTAGTVGRQSTTHLPSDVAALEGSVARIGNQAPHHSIFGRVLDVLSRPMYAMAEGTRQAFESDVQGKSIRSDLGSFAKGAWGGLEGKHKTDFTDVVDEAGALMAAGDKGKSLQQALKDYHQGKVYGNEIPGWLRVTSGLAGDIFLDPTTYIGVGAVAKIPQLAKLPEDIQKANKALKVLEEGGVVGRDLSRAKTVLHGLKNAKEGAWVDARTLGTSASRAQRMKWATHLAGRYSAISYDKAISETLPKVTKQFATKGLKEAQNPEDLIKIASKGLPSEAKSTKFLQSIKAAGRAPTAADVEQFNYNLGQDIRKAVEKAVGERTTHMVNSTKDFLDIAARNNIAGKVNPRDLERAIQLRMTGKPVATLALPKGLTTGVHAALASEKAQNVLDPVKRIHGFVDQIFRTGSHIDPVVNAIRMARHSSVVDKINQHVVNLNSIWGKVNKDTRARIADNVVNGRLAVNNIKGGRDFKRGMDVTDMVGHTFEEMRHLESLVGNHDKALITPGEFNKAMPKNWQVPVELFKSPNWLQRVWKEHYMEGIGVQGKLSKDPAAVLHIIQKGILSAAADKEMQRNLIERFGHELYAPRVTKAGAVIKGQVNPLVRVLKEQHGYRAPRVLSNNPEAARKELDVVKTGKGKQPSIIPGYERHIFEPDVAKGIEAMHKMLHGELLNNTMTNDPLVKLMSQATMFFKTAVTKFNPGFHIRNLIGEVANGTADGVTNPKWYKQSWQVLRLHGVRDLETGERASGHLGRREMRVRNALHDDGFAAARIPKIAGHDIVLQRKFQDLGTKGVTADQIWHAYVANGLKTGWITTDAGKYIGTGARRLARANAFTQHVTENIEDYARLAHFISRIERSHFTHFQQAAEEAAQYVRKFHFDYNDFSHTERAFISKAIPFYKWTRKNIPLQLALMFQKPGYLLTQMKLLNSVSRGMGYRGNGQMLPNAGEVMPLWLRDHLAVPVGMGQSGTRYLDAPLPTKDAFQFFGEGPRDTANSAGFMLNPLLKDPLELLTQHQIGGAPVQGSNYAASMTPYSAILNNLFKKNNTGKHTQLMQFLLALGLQENTPQRIKGELKREQQEGAANRKKYRAAHHMTPLGNL